MKKNKVLQVRITEEDWFFLHRLNKTPCQVVRWLIKQFRMKHEQKKVLQNN